MNPDRYSRTGLKRCLLLAALITLSACSSDNNPPAVQPPPPAPPAMASYTVTVTNLTNAQPLSPIAVIAHGSGYRVFTVGSPATAGLETLAEGGDNAALLAEADGSGEVIATASGAAPIGPAGSESVTFDVLDRERPGLFLSVTTMLVNTNDAFSGLNSQPLETLPVGESLSFDAIAYDAGTEADTELGAEIPGPAGGGEGFNAVRDDEADRVAMHSGVVSQDDGLSGSALTEQHRFDNPVLRVRVERTL